MHANREVGILPVHAKAGHRTDVEFAQVELVDNFSMNTRGQPAFIDNMGGCHSKTDVVLMGTCMHLMFVVVVVLCRS